MNLRVKTEVEVTPLQLAGLLCSAFEGGSSYWVDELEVNDPRDNDQIRADFNKLIGEEEYFHVAQILPFVGGKVVVQWSESDERFRKVLDAEAVERGLQVMAKNYGYHFQQMLDGNDDATTGDVFLQCCLLGEVLYG